MKRKKWIRIWGTALLIACLALCTACGSSDSGAHDSDSSDAQGAAQLEQIEAETAAQLIKLLYDAGEVGPGNEWSIIGIARSSHAEDPEAQALFQQYQDNLRLQVKRSGGVLDPERPTDNARAAIALQLTGGDPSNVEGYDLLAQLEDMDAVKAQGINAEIWALIAASCCNRQLDATDHYLEDLINMQSDEGGITYDGQTADVDITAMAIQALAPYASGQEDIEGIIDDARIWLSDQQAPTGDFGNSESTSQVILAIAAMGDDPVTAEDFTQLRGGLLEGQLRFRVQDGFCHADGGEMDVMATEQALCALDAMELAARGETLF